MKIVFIFILLTIGCISLLIVDKKRKEKYKLMGELAMNRNGNIVLRRVIQEDKEDTLTGGAKYGRGSDYDRRPQKRATGQIRDTGEDG